MCQSKDNGGRRCAAHAAQQAATSYIPRSGNLRAYYAAADKKHIGESSVGSRFVDPKMRRLNDVVAEAYRQRGSLAGDDRVDLMNAGAARDAFTAECRYLLVRTGGLSGIVPASELPSGTVIRFVRAKPGAPVTPTVSGFPYTETNVATIVIGPHPDNTGREVVYTAHPGVPIPSSQTDTYANVEGRSVALRDFADEGIELPLWVQVSN